MSVLFMMQAWSAPSELWIQRMIEALEPDVEFVASRKPTEARWNGRIPALAISDDLPWLWRRNRLAITTQLLKMRPRLRQLADAGGKYLA